MSVDERSGPLSVGGSERPEMATLNIGTINFGDDIFVNRRLDTFGIAERIAQAGIIPEIEIYDLGHLDILRELVDKGAVKRPLHVQFVLGVRGALQASERNLELLVSRLNDDFPGSSWGVAGVGRHELPMAEVAARLGGNVRVGLEDNIFLEKGVLAKGSAELCEKAVAICQAVGRKVATLDEARAILLAKPAP